MGKFGFMLGRVGNDRRTQQRRLPLILEAMRARDERDLAKLYQATEDARNGRRERGC